jgi:hypothetical protein
MLIPNIVKVMRYSKSSSEGTFWYNDITKLHKFSLYFKEQNNEEQANMRKLEEVNEYQNRN